VEIFSDPLPCLPTVLLSPHNRRYWDLHEGAGGHTYRRAPGSWGGGGAAPSARSAGPQGRPWMGIPPSGQEGGTRHPVMWEKASLPLGANNIDVLCVPRH